MQRFLSHGSFSYLVLASAVTACTVNSAPPATPAAEPAPAPAPPPAPVASSNAALTPAPAPAAPAPAAPAPAAKHHHHPLVELLFRSVESLELKPEQKTAVASIESDLDKSGEGPRAARAKLDSDLADQVAAGKLERPKIDADVNALKAAITSSETALQDALNRLHQTLDAEQRKKLVATMQDKGREMRARHQGEHERWAPPGAEGLGKGPEPQGSKGPAGSGDHGDHEKGPHDHGGVGHKDGPGKGPRPDAGGQKGEPGTHQHPGGAAAGPGGAAAGPGGPGMGPGGGGHFAKLWEELQLTPEQRQKIQAKLGAQMKARQGTMKAQMAAHEKHLAAIATAFEAEKFDAKTAGVGGKGADMVKAMIDSRIAFVEAVFDVLTPEQRAKFAAHLKAHTDSEADDD